MLCIKKRDELMDGQTNNPEAICPSNFFEVGGIIKTAGLVMVYSLWKSGYFQKFSSLDEL